MLGHFKHLQNQLPQSAKASVQAVQAVQPFIKNASTGTEYRHEVQTETTNSLLRGGLEAVKSYANVRQNAPGSDEFHLSFIEEPLGMKVDDRCGWAHVDFLLTIGPDDRYLIVRKLGWGGYSSTWLARDQK